METKGGDQNSNWRLDLKDFRLPDRSPSDHKSSFCFQSILRRQRKQKRVADYYKRQETLTEGFREMEVMNESSYIPGKLTEDEMKQLARSERIAINVSNVANFLLFISKVVASAESKSLAVIASTLDNFLDLLFGFILWFTAHAMKTPNQYKYPIGKKRMQPVGIIVFASITATLGLEVVLESGKDLINKDGPDMSHQEEKWMIGIMVFATVVKFMLMIYCGRFKNEIVRAYALDHFFEVISGSVGLATAVIANRYYWWTDSVGAILIALFTMHTWAKTVVENVHLLIGNTAPPDFLKKLTFLVWNHNEEIKHIKTVRAYTSGSYYFAEIEIVLPCNMILSKAHNIGETLKVKLEQLPEIERAFVNTDFELTLAPQHNTDV